jgi:hypothetical protein
MHRPSLFPSVLATLVLLARPALVAAQDPPQLHDRSLEDSRNTSVVNTERRLAAQEQLVEELLQRLDSLAAGNAALLQRLATLETAQKAGSVTTVSDAVSPNGSEAQQPEPGALAPVEEQTARLEERLDALPKVVGYYDFEFSKEDRGGTFGEFRQHHLSLHFSKEYDKLRVFSEVEFEHAPHFAADTGTELESNGGIAVEQAWGEYLRSDAFTLRAGFMLTPNYLNVNHYPNTTASTRLPLMVRNVYPENFVGVMGFGSKYWGGFGLGYNAYVSNGEGRHFAEHDDNNGKGIGGALKFDLPTGGLFETLKFDVNGYADTPAHERTTRTWGLESQARRGPFELLFEFARRRAAENRTGAYLQPSYRLTDRLMAFYRYDRLFVAANGETQANTWGVNLRPISPVSLKFELFRTILPGAQRFNGIASSLAVAF